MASIKKLNPDNVEYIIVHSTMTNPDIKVTPEAFLQQRKTEGYLDMGFHRLIDRKGKTSKLMSLSTAGAHTPRYSDNAVGVLLVGGKDVYGKAISSYTVEQLVSLQETIKEIQETYPKAKPVGYQELYSGNNPGFSVSSLMENT